MTREAKADEERSELTPTEGETSTGVNEQPPMIPRIQPANSKPEPSGETDILWGATAIGQAIGRSPRSTFHMLERGSLPARKVGRLWSASRSKLLAFVAGEAAQ